MEPLCAEVRRSHDLTPEAPPLVALMPVDLDGVAEELAAYQAHFAPLFARREQREWAAVY